MAFDEHMDFNDEMLDCFDEWSMILIWYDMII